MQKVVYENGVVLYWDDTLQVGELITAHDDGYHLLTGFDYREGATPLIHYVMVVKPDGTKVKKPGVTRRCDAFYVRRVTKEDIESTYRSESSTASLKRANLLNFMPQ